MDYILIICDVVTIITFWGFIFSKLWLINQSKTEICEDLSIVLKTTHKKDKIRKKSNFLSLQENEELPILKVRASLSFFFLLYLKVMCKNKNFVP